MKNKYELIYEGKAKKVFSHKDVDKVIIEFKDDATAFNSLKKARFEGKGKLNCQISSKIFELLINRNIPTHFLELKNDELNDPLITKDRIELMKIISSKDLDFITNQTLKINGILKSFFKNIHIELVDFKLEFGYDIKNNIILGDEISPDNCRLWDLNQNNDTIISLDKDRFRNDLGGLIEAYSEINRRINDFI